MSILKKIKQLVIPKPNYKKMYEDMRKEHADMKFRLEKLQNMIRHGLDESEK